MTPGEAAGSVLEHSEGRGSPPGADVRRNARMFEEEASALVQVPAMDVALDVDEVGPPAAERLKHAGMLEEQAPAFAQVPEGPACIEVDAFEIAVRPEGAEPLNEDDGMIVEASLEIRQVAPDPPNSPVLEEATSSRLVIKLPPRPSPPRPRRSARTTMRKEGYNS